MNSQGYTKDNIHKGNTKIVAGGIDVDGLVRIGDQSVGGDGYVLPAVKGTEGQVLTMNADNTTSFKDNASGSMTRVGAGNNNTISIPATTLGVPLVPSFEGVKIVDIKNIPPGSSYIIEAVSSVQFTYDGTSPTIQSYLGVNLNLSLGGTSSNTINVNNQSNPNVYPSPVVVGTIYRANWYYKAIITRNFNGTAFYISTFSTMNRFGNPNYYVNMPTIPTGAIFFTIDGDPDDTTIDFDLTIDQALGAGTIVRYEGPSINWYVSQIDEVNPPTLLTNDHTQLTNLNSGDSGHSQFALLQGRSGSQILSGGVGPLENLTLKAHNAGLNNIVIKDLNTTFEKNIDMDGNQINNVVSVDNSGPLALGDLVKGNTIILDRDISNGVYLESNPAQDITLNAGGGTNFFKVRASDVLMGSNLDMNNNDITNSADVIGPGGTLRLGVAAQMSLLATNTLCLCTLNGNTIYDTRSPGAPTHVFRINNNGRLVIGDAGIDFKSVPVDFDNQNLTSVNQVSSNGVLNLQGALGNRVDIGVGGSGRLEVEDTRVFISQFADLNIQDKIVYVQPGTMPPVFDDGKTYIFIGSRTTSTPIVLNGISVTFKGSSRETSSIEYTGAGSFITATDCDLSLIDLTLKCDVSGSLLLTASNPSKLNVLSILNCEIRESYEFADISGHELVDINNTLFIHLRGDGVLTNQKCIYINGVAKTNITSCEIVKFFEVGQPANTNPFDGAMIYVTGACGAVSIIGGIIHPRVNQRAVEIDNTATFLEFALNTNNFIDIGLTTGAILQTNSNVDWDTNATSEANSLLPNLKSFVGAQLSAQNTNNTATTLNTPVDINFGALLTPFSSFGTAVAGTGGVSYIRKRPVNFQVTFVANLQAINGGSGQRIALSTSKNGVNTGIKSFVTLDSAGTEPKQCVLTLVGQAEQGDVFRSQLINETTNSDIRCLDLLISGIEI